jgi:Zn-dependent peptidase ImmA (M78 family)
MMQPARLAELVRHTYSRCMGPPVDVRSIARQAGIEILEWPFVDSELCGLLHWTHNVPVIIVNSRHSWQRQRFTIAHELYHFMVDMPSPRAALMLKKGNPKGRERQADRFAAQLLMDADLVCQLYQRGESVEQLCGTMGVSRPAMNIRLNELRREGRL